MSIIVVADIGFQPYAMYRDPGLPERVWTCSVSSIGDASGGNNVLQVNLKSQGVPPGNIFSLERLTLRASDVAVTAMRISLSGMETYPPGFDIPFWTAATVNTDLGDDSDLPLEHANTRLFLGRAGEDGAAGTISLATENDLNETIDSVLMGYMWTPGAINAPGGPRRPAEGVFSN